MRVLVGVVGVKPDSCSCVCQAGSNPSGSQHVRTQAPHHGSWGVCTQWHGSRRVLWASLLAVFGWIAGVPLGCVQQIGLCTAEFVCLFQFRGCRGMMWWGGWAWVPSLYVCVYRFQADSSIVGLREETERKTHSQT